MHVICFVNLPWSATARLRKVSLQLSYLSVFSLIKRVFRDALKIKGSRKCEPFLLHQPFWSYGIYPRYAAKCSRNSEDYEFHRGSEFPHLQGYYKDNPVHNPTADSTFNQAEFAAVFSAQPTSAISAYHKADI